MVKHKIATADTGGSAPVPNGRRVGLAGLGNGRRRGIVQIPLQNQQPSSLQTPPLSSLQDPPPYWLQPPLPSTPTVNTQTSEKREDVEKKEDVEKSKEPGAIVVDGTVEIGIDVFPGPPDKLAISREFGVDAPSTLALSPGLDIILESPTPDRSAGKTPISPRVQIQSVKIPQSIPTVKVCKKRRAPFLTYEAAMWIIHIILVVVCCADRFIWNVWPRQNTFKISGKKAGGDEIDGLLDGPWSVKLYDILARISGRYSIIALNLMLFVRLRTVESWLSASWINRYVVDCSNIVTANLRLHIWNGYAMVVLMLLHVWSILFPCVFHGYGVQVLSGHLEWPLSERKPAGFKDANATAEMMSMQVDDVFRVVEITIIFGIMAPLSYWWFWRKWHIAIHIHRIMAAVFCIDMVRRHTHPHSILLNIPVFVIWIIDKIVFSYWGFSTVSQLHRIMLGDDYMVLLWKSEGDLSKTIGPNFYLKLTDSSISENSHAFTAFQNRRLIQLKDVQGDWNTGIVVRIFRNKRKYPLSKKDAMSHTSRMATVENKPGILETYGPYTGEMSELIKNSVNRAYSNSCKAHKILPGGSCGSCFRAMSGVFQEDGPVVLIGTGSGINYLLDAIQYRFTGGQQLVILWSTGDNFLFSWVRKILNEMVSSDDTHLRIVLANTDKLNMIKQAWSEANQHNATSQTTRSKSAMSPVEWYDSQNSHSDKVRYVSGRIPFEEEIPHNSTVFFQGSLAVRKAVNAACVKNSCTAYFGRGSNSVRKIVFKELAQRSLVYVNQSFRRLSQAVDDMHLKRRLSQAAPNVSFRSTPNMSREPSMKRSTTEMFGRDGSLRQNSRETSRRWSRGVVDVELRASDRHSTRSTIFENKVFQDESEVSVEYGEVLGNHHGELQQGNRDEEKREEREEKERSARGREEEKIQISSPQPYSWNDFYTPSYSYGDYSYSEDSYALDSDEYSDSD